MTMGILFGFGVTLTILGILNYGRGVDAGLSWLLTVMIGIGSGMLGSVLNTWVDRLAKKP